MNKIKKPIIIFMPSIDGGGVEKNLFIISNYLKNLDYKIKIITFDDGFNYKFSKKIQIINYLKKPKKNYSKYYKYWKCILLLIKETIIKRQLVFSFQANVYCCILSFIFNFNLITRSNSSPSGWTKNFTKNLLFKYLLKIPKAIIVNSKIFKKEIDKKFNINSVLIYNPLNLKEIKTKSKEKLNFHFFKNTKIKAINIGRFTDQKDQITLLKAIKILNECLIDIKLLIMGYGPNKNNLKKFINENNLNNKIKILKFQKNPYKYLNQSNLFLLTSIYEGLPNVLLEAMALKKYIISTDCPTGPREILGNGKYGILTKINNEKLLAKKILLFSKKKNLSNILNKAYKSLNRFDFNQNCKKYNDVIKKYI